MATSYRTHEILVHTRESSARHCLADLPRMAVFSTDCEAAMATTQEPDLNPGDEASPGTPGAGEDVCEACSGSGKLSDGKPCPQCGGSGRVMRGIGGG